MSALATRARDRILTRLSWWRYRDLWYRQRIRRVMSLASRQQAGVARTVRLLGNFPGLWQRTLEQTPAGSCQWGRTLFVCEGKADHYLILNSIRRPTGNRFLPEVALPGRERVWGLHMEPEEYVRLLGYDTVEEHALVSRFYTSSEDLVARGGVYRASPPYVHFLTGKSWDFLAAAPPPEKRITLGIVTSELRSLQGQQARLRFLEAIDASGIEYALWGRGEGLRRFRGYRGFAFRKWDALAQCRYSVVMENSVSPWYWSEKIADALLSWTLPLYHGCPRIDRFLPTESFIPIDISDPECVERVRATLRADPYAARLQAIATARKVLLERENLYAFIDRELEVLACA